MKLRKKDIYDYYDIPLLYSAVDEKNNIFICLYADESETAIRYICTQVSSATLKQLEHNDKDIRALFEIPEFKILYTVYLNNESEKSAEAIETTEDITRFLPDQGLFIGKDDPPAEKVRAIAAKTVPRRRKAVGIG
jgi:hypothetical protein